MVRRENYSPGERLIHEMANNEDGWRKRGACHPDSEDWRPEYADIEWLPDLTTDSVLNRKLEAPAKEVCRKECKVRLECMHHAITFPEEFGIWGGMNIRELNLAAKNLRKLRGKR